MSGNPRLLLLYWNGIFKCDMLLFIEKRKSEYREEMIHKLQTIRLSFLEFQSLVYNELNNVQKSLCRALFLTCTYFQFFNISESLNTHNRHSCVYSYKIYVILYSYSLSTLPWTLPWMTQCSLSCQWKIFRENNKKKEIRETYDDAR